MNKQTSSKIISLLLILLLLTSIGVSIWAWMNRCQHPEHPPEFNIPAIDINAEEIYQKENTTSGENHVNIMYDGIATISISKKEATINFENPATSTHDIRLSFSVNNTIVGTSGLIPPGYKLEKLTDLNVNSIQLLGTTNGKYIIEHFHPETGEKAIFTTEAVLDGVHIVE